MAMSPYRFSISEKAPQPMRTRTGLAGVTTGGATSGGEAYSAAALRPGSAGYMAAGFGSAPRTDYVRPVAASTPTPEPAPTLAPATPKPEDADPAAGAQARGGNMAEGEGANGGPGGLAAEPSTPTSGWLADMLANVGITNPGYGMDNPDGIPGASTQPGGQADVDAEAATGWGGYDGSYGPQLPGDWGGPAATGGGTSGGSGPAGASTMGGGQADVDAEAASGGAPGASGSQSDADAAAEAAQGGGTQGGGAQSQGEPGEAGYARGGPVNRLMKPAGLGQVHAMGSYAEGGMVDGAALAGPDPAGPDDGFAALDGGEFVVQAQQAQRPDYGPILEQMNAGTYEPGEGPEHEDAETMSQEGMMPAEGQTVGDPGALAPDLQRALMDAMQSDPVLAAALMQLLGPDAAHSLVDSTEETSPAPIATGRPPLAGPAPMPGMHAPPGVRPPDAATPTRPMPPMAPPRPGGGLAGVMA